MTDFASTSLPRHLIRGAAGFGALLGSIALIPHGGLISLLLAPIGLVALRGCPTCWTIGLIQTISRGRLQRACVDGHCTLTITANSAQPQKSGSSLDGTASVSGC